jgi:dCMP deaminase
MKPKFIDYYMKIAEVTSGLSYAKRLQVGAVIVKDNQILATGYNGMPSGWENNCEYTEFMPIGNTDTKSTDYPFIGSFWIDGHSVERRYRLTTRPEVLHAESNAIAKVSQSTESSNGSTLFCTHAPCIECAKLIYQSGIKTVYYRDEYRSSSGLKFLELSGVNVHRYPVSI